MLFFRERKIDREEKANTKSILLLCVVKNERIKVANRIRDTHTEVNQTIFSWLSIRSSAFCFLCILFSSSISFLK